MITPVKEFTDNLTKAIQAHENYKAFVNVCALMPKELFDEALAFIFQVTYRDYMLRELTGIGTRSYEDYAESIIRTNLESYVQVFGDDGRLQ